MSRSSNSLSLSELTDLFRVLHLKLSVGQMPLEIFEDHALRSSGSLRRIAPGVIRELRKGGTFSDALKPHAPLFPPLVLPLLRVGEESGNLAEICGELEKHFEERRRRHKKFRSMMILPAFLFLLAILVLSVLTFFLGILGSDVDPLGLGLTGPTGAVVLFGASIGIVFIIVLFVQLIRKSDSWEAKLLRAPMIGPALEALALSRFNLAMSLLTETSLSLEESVRLSLNATENRVFRAGEKEMIGGIRRGEELWAVLKNHGFFPSDYVHRVQVGEEAGHLSETFRREAKHYGEEADHRCVQLMQGVGYGIWCVVGLVIVIAIMRLGQFYVDVISGAR